MLFVATAEAGDEEMRRRIKEHQKARPVAWSTFEATRHVGSQISQKFGEAQIVIVDCITLLISNIFLQYNHTGEHIDTPLVEKEVATEIGALTDCFNLTQASFIIVTNEIGLGLVPADRLSRLYRDLLGKANQTLAQRVDEVYLLMAGIPLMMKPNKTL